MLLVSTMALAPPTADTLDPTREGAVMSAVQASANEPTSRAYSTSPLAREVAAGSISPKVT
jgi:hypothetical protein